MSVKIRARTPPKLALDPRQFFREQRPPKFVYVRPEILDPRAGACFPFLSPVSFQQLTAI